MKTENRKKLYAIGAVLLVAIIPARAQERAHPSVPSASAQTNLPAWFTRGLPGEGHAALNPLIGDWKQHKSVYGVLGRSPEAPPLVSTNITTHREWVAGGHYIEDFTEGTIDGSPYWRKGWLGYSIMDRRYEWVTIDGINTTMMAYLGNKGSGVASPIVMTGTFTDQGVLNENTVGKTVGQRTVITIENHDRHVIELFFTPPGGKEQLVDRTIYTRVKK